MSSTEADMLSCNFTNAFEDERLTTPAFSQVILEYRPEMDDFNKQPKRRTIKNRAIVKNLFSKFEEIYKKAMQNDNEVQITYQGRDILNLVGNIQPQWPFKPAQASHSLGYFQFFDANNR